MPDQEPDLPPEVPRMDPEEFDRSRERTSQIWRTLGWLLVALLFVYVVSMLPGGT